MMRNSWVLMDSDESLVMWHPLLRGKQQTQSTGAMPPEGTPTIYRKSVLPTRNIAGGASLIRRKFRTFSETTL